MAKRNVATDQPTRTNPIAVIGGILALGVIRSIKRAEMESTKTSGVPTSRSAAKRSTTSWR